jgi:phosphoribosyl 1,2-cyclic phosphodiesterase
MTSGRLAAKATRQFGLGIHCRHDFKYAAGAAAATSLVGVAIAAAAAAAGSPSWQHNQECAGSSIMGPTMACTWPRVGHWGKTLCEAAAAVVSTTQSPRSSLPIPTEIDDTAAMGTHEAQHPLHFDDKSRLIFLGTGSSTGCPRPLCAMVFANSDDVAKDDQDAPALSQLRARWAPYCRTSSLAIQGGNPRYNKNYRNNPSLLISVAVNDDTTNDSDPQQFRRNVLIDAGKTFREGALRWFPVHGIRSLDAIVLTHQHMDAAAGLDDVRGFQNYVPTQRGKKPVPVPMPLAVSTECLACLQDQFPWLLPPPPPSPAAAAAATATSSAPLTDEDAVVSRHVASFDVTVFAAFEPLKLLGGALTVIPLPVMHGEDLVSFGFAFTVPNVARPVHDNDHTSVALSTAAPMNVVYLSDISRMLPETLEYIQTRLPQPTHLLVLDALHRDDELNPVHYNLSQALALVEQIQPQQTYLVGMNCDSFLPHDAMNAELSTVSQTRRLGPVQLAHDGLDVTHVSVSQSDEP